jgi:hypothetical protein
VPLPPSATPSKARYAGGGRAGQSDPCELGVLQPHWLRPRGDPDGLVPVGRSNARCFSMIKTSADDHVLPRPVERLPEFAHAKARRTLAERLVAAFQISEVGATAIADAVVDPAAVRKAIGEADAPQVDEVPVPGGVLLGIRTQIWSRRVMPDPRNPRIGPSRRHPFAVDPGTGSEESKFRPVPEPRSPEGKIPDTPELEVEVESRHHLTWASAQAKQYILAENNWKTSIESQGVMEGVWVAPTTYRHTDGTPQVTVLTTVEGSSRMTAVHEILQVRSADVPYEEYEQKLRANVRRLNDAFDRGVNAEQAVFLRCERIPALILVGFRKHPGSNTGFPTAVKSLVALRHVDPPKPWGEGPENESLADEVLDEFYRRDLISAIDRSYYAGACTRAEARAAHLSDDPVNRAARIVALFTTADERRDEALRIAVTSQSTRKRITPKLRNELATALVVRSVAGDGGKTDQVRRYMRHAFGKAVHREQWESTDRDIETLAKEAMREVVRAIGDLAVTEPGPVSLELAVRAAYPLVVTGRLNADRGTANNDQPDRRTPGEVLDAMRRTIQGVHQLAQALRDFAEDRHIRAVNEDGSIRKLFDRSGDQLVTDVFLRDEFPPPGKGRTKRTGDTPTEQLHNRMVDFGEAMDRLQETFEAIGKVLGDDGSPLVEFNGTDPRSCVAWREVLKGVDDELTIWGRTFRKRHGTPPEPQGGDSLDGLLNDGDMGEVADDTYDASYDGWDDAEKSDRDEVTA